MARSLVTEVRLLSLHLPAFRFWPTSFFVGHDCWYFVAPGKRLEPAPTVLKINFEYCVNVNVDAIIYDQAWIIPRFVYQPRAVAT